MLGFPNRVDRAALSGGSFYPRLPLENLKDRLIGRPARTTDTALASSMFVVDLGRTAKVQDVTLRGHNLTLAAKYRICASNSADFSSLLYDSDWKLVWPVVFPWETLEWEDDNFWSGQYTEEEMDGYTPELGHTLPESKVARYWRIELDDRANPKGYIQLGRLFIGPVWQPEINMSYGASIEWVPNTDVQTSRSGAEYFDRRSAYRLAKFSLDWLEQDEAFAKAFELQRQAGIDREVLFIHDPDDKEHAMRRRFLGRLQSLNPILYPQFDVNSTAFEVKEI